MVAAYNKKRFAQNLRARLKEKRRKGVTNREIADRIGIDPRTIGYWKKAQHLPKSDLTLRELAKALGVNLSDLLGRQAEPGGKRPSLTREEAQSYYVDAERIIVGSAGEGRSSAVASDDILRIPYQGQTLIAINRIPRSGEAAFVRLQDGTQLLRRVEYGQVAGVEVVTLRSLAAGREDPGLSYRREQIKELLMVIGAVF